MAAIYIQIAFSSKWCINLKEKKIKLKEILSNEQQNTGIVF